MIKHFIVALSFILAFNTMPKPQRAVATDRKIFQKPIVDVTLKK